MGMSKWDVIHLEKKSYALGKVRSEVISGQVEITADPTGRNAALVLRPVEWLVAQNEEHRKRGITEYRPGSNMAFSVMTLLPLSKKEAFEAYKAEPGHILVLRRKSPQLGDNEYRLRKIQ